MTTLIVLGLLFGLLALGVPAALLWAILAFLCSFIPNVGYFIAIVPPLVFGYLTGGWGTVVAIIVVYGIINAVVQSIVRAHDGEVTARPRPDGGLDVTVTLPAAPP